LGGAARADRSDHQSVNWTLAIALAAMFVLAGLAGWMLAGDDRREDQRRPGQAAE